MDNRVTVIQLPTDVFRHVFGRRIQTPCCTCILWVIWRGVTETVIALDNAAIHTNMAASVDTQIATHAAKKLLSIKVSNFMAVLHPISN